MAIREIFGTTERLTKRECLGALKKRNIEIIRRVLPHQFIALYIRKAASAVVVINESVSRDQCLLYAAMKLLYADLTESRATIILRDQDNRETDPAHWFARLCLDSVNRIPLHSIRPAIRRPPRR